MTTAKAPSAVVRNSVRARAVLHGTAALCGLALSGVASAEEAGADTPAQTVNEIIVTAAKREQTLQDVPIAVSVTSDVAIERAHIRDIKDLSTLVPSLRVRTNQTSANTNFFIRGFGNGANNPGIEPSVGVFVDNVYASRAVSRIADLPDIERIEVLRGPQSTLFGKNASAGVISIVTKRPQFEFGVNVEASYGNRDAVVLKGVVTGPLSDTIAASLSGSYNRRDGFTSNPVTGDRTDERNRWFARGQILFEPNSEFSVRLIGDYGKINEICCSVVNLKASGATTALRALGGKVNSVDEKFDGVAYSNFDSPNKIKTYGLSGQIDYQFDDFKLSSITSWRKNDSFSNFDVDFSSADIVGGNPAALDIETFTQEVRFTANPFDGVTALLGAFYFNEKIDQSSAFTWGTQARPYFNLMVRGATNNALNIPLLEQTFGTLEGNPAKYVNTFFEPGQGLTESYRLRNEAISIFGQVDWEIVDRLTLTGGINYTRDKKRFALDAVSNDSFAGVNFNNVAYAPFRRQVLLGRALQSGLAPTAAAAFADANQNNPMMNPLNALRVLQIMPPFLGVPNAVEPGRTNDDNVSWSARLSYDATDRITLYGGVAKGFKASSINLSRDSRPLLADAAAINGAGISVVNQTYGSRLAGPEKATVYEAGLKADWGVAGANVAVFKQDIRGFQSNIFTGTGFFLGNAGKQSVFGIEFEGFAKPVPALTLGLALTYLDPKYDDFPNSAFGDATGMTPADIPPVSATFSADYVHDLAGDNRLIFHVDYHYESTTQQIEGLPAFIVKDSLSGAVIDYKPGIEAARHFKRQIDEVNASLTLALANGLELSAWSRNLLNDRYVTQIFDSPAQAGSVSGYINQPRTYGTSARFRW